jgi:hypothetical protein
MRIGVDFDNTIVCYDALFQRVARETGAVPEEIPANKSEVRNHLRRTGREELWTELQGLVYGPRIIEATPYPGVKDFFMACRKAARPVRIISHKTRHPFLGVRHDLHAAALRWLEKHEFFDPEGIGLTRDDVFLELTKEAKLERIAQTGCTHFIDDLPEFLGETGFPPRVERILFDPHALYAAESRFVRVESWSEATARLGLMRTAQGSPSGESTGDEPQIREFLRKSTGAGSIHRVQPLPGGANNRVRRVDANGGVYVLKMYFQHPADPRDRYAAEHAFYSWAWAQGIRQIPEPIAWDASGRFGLFRFVPGRKLESGAELTDGHLEQALEFVRELNIHRDDPAARSIPAASEACFSIAEHLECIGRRVARLANLQTGSESARAARAFIDHELTPAWEAAGDRVRQAANRFLNEPLGRTARCLSPSDFGFHNAMIGAGDRVWFFDFEYAGWDDPAKLVCDFFCQPRVPVGLQHWDRFVARMEPLFGTESGLSERAALLLPLYRIKWCCILLNEFLRDESARRLFAGTQESAEVRKVQQLEKARHMLALLRAR